MTHVRGADNGVWRSFGASSHVGYQHATNFPRFRPNGTGRDSYIYNDNGGWCNDGRSEMAMYKDSLRSEMSLSASKPSLKVHPAQELAATRLSQGLHSNGNDSLKGTFRSSGPIKYTIRAGYAFPGPVREQQLIAESVVPLAHTVNRHRLTQPQTALPRVRSRLVYQPRPFSATVPLTAAAVVQQ